MVATVGHQDRKEREQYRVPFLPMEKCDHWDGELPIMADPSRQERAEIDTTSPFRSVRDAVNMFGDINGRKLRASEKRIPKEAETPAWEELAKVRDQLKHADDAKAEALLELAEARKLLREMNQKLQDTNMSKELVKEALEVTTVGADDFKVSQEEEKHITSAAELKEVNKAQPLSALAELEIVKCELEKLKQELLDCMEERDSAVRQAEKVLAAADVNTKRAKELTIALSGTSESLMLDKLACIEAIKERTAPLTAKSFEIWTEQSQELVQRLAAAEQLELKLAATTDELQCLRAELAILKEAEEKIARVAAEAMANLDEAKSELEQTRLSETSAISCVTFLSYELQEAKKTLINALDDATSLKTMMESLQDELQLIRKELVDLRDREAFATAAAASLTAELAKTKAELAAAAAAGVEANEVITGLSQAFENVKAEAEEAKLEADCMREEARKARRDAEQAKAAMDTAESKWQAALKEADAAKAAETIALGRITALSEEAIFVRASGVKIDPIFTISQDEYDALQKKIEEGEKLTSIRVAAALAQVEAAKSSEQEIQQKLRTSEDDLEEMRKATKQALHKVEMAEAAKSAVEGELRQLKEKEQRRRERVIAVTQPPTEQLYITSGDGDQSFSFGTTHVAPLGKVLNMKIPSTERGCKTLEKSHTQKKKKHMLPSLGGYLVKK